MHVCFCWTMPRGRIKRLYVVHPAGGVCLVWVSHLFLFWALLVLRMTFKGGIYWCWKVKVPSRARGVLKRRTRNFLVHCRAREVSCQVAVVPSPRNLAVQAKAQFGGFHLQNDARTPTHNTSIAGSPGRPLFDNGFLVSVTQRSP